jgi:hypothetical protein
MVLRFWIFQLLKELNHVHKTLDSLIKDYIKYKRETEWNCNYKLHLVEVSNEF